MLKLLKYCQPMRKSRSHMLQSPRRRCAMFVAGWCLTLCPLATTSQTVKVSSFGAVPDSGRDATPAVLQAIERCRELRRPRLVFERGRYDFWPDYAAHRHYYISNHDPLDDRLVTMPLEGYNGFTLDGNGAQFVFHGVILPISVVNSSRVILKNFAIDFDGSHVLETHVLRAEGDFVDLKIPAEDRYEIRDGKILLVALKWTHLLGTSQEFDSRTRAVAWNTHADLDFDAHQAQELSPGVIRVSGLPSLPTPGNVLVIWDRDRPAPAIWVSESQLISVERVDVHRAMGMGFLAQRSAFIHLNGFRVTLPMQSDRFVTTEADAVHFSNCRGRLVVENGLFENMLDDGINVHGSYLKIARQLADDAVIAEWGHPQTLGFAFASRGEHIAVVDAHTLAETDEMVVRTVSQPDPAHVELHFDRPMPCSNCANYVLANLDWQPHVVYRNNIVRRNRSRGSIFKTRNGAIIEGNTYDHLSGPAILLTADASSWFESIPAENVLIRNNRFIDQVSSYGPAPIVIRSRADAASKASEYTFRNIRIENNKFDVFQTPLIVATSVEGLAIASNRVRENSDFRPFSSLNGTVFVFEHCKCVDVRRNLLPWKLDSGTLKAQDTTLIRINSKRAENDGSTWMQGCADRDRE
jgi:hypothetical protein